MGLGPAAVPELALAGVLGSAVYNSIATLGVAALVPPVRVALPATVAAVPPLVLLAYRGAAASLAQPVLDCSS